MKRARWDAGWWSAARPIASTHCGPRPPGTAIDLVVLHSISLPPGVYGGEAIEQLFTGTLDPDAHPAFAPLRGLRVSAHFVVRRDGELLQFVPTHARAWHAGASSWRGRSDCNDYSIGIELEGLEGECFEPPQYDRLAVLLRAVARAHPLRGVAGHEHIAPGRKGDPGARFDWPRVRRQTRFPAAWFPASVDLRASPAS